MDTKTVLNLNQFYTSNASIINSVFDNSSAYYFDSQTERGAVTTTKVQFISADKIAAGTVTVAMNLGTNVGSAYMILDGANNRIVVNDGTTNRVVIGNI